MKNLRLKKKFISQERTDQLGGFAQEVAYQNQLKFSSLLLLLYLRIL